MRRKLEARHIEAVDERMAAIYRAMPTEQKGRIVAECNETMRAMIRARLESDHPEWTEDQINAEIARRFLGDRTTRMIRLAGILQS